MKMNLRDILFIDIETVPVCSSFDQLSPGLQKHWRHKAGFLYDAEHLPSEQDSFLSRAGVYSEFGKVVCIGLGIVVMRDNKEKLFLKSIAEDDEKSLLKKFASVIDELLETHTSIVFGGHNIKEFDLPFLCRRFLINGLPLPLIMQIQGKKPWEVHHLDTLEMWKFGDYKHYTSLDLLAQVLGVPSPKDDMDGSMVGQAYWENNDLKSISKYCLKDVHTTCSVYLKLIGHPESPLEPLYV